MRKIYTYSDWQQFIIDLLENTNGKYEYFGISRDGNGWDGQAVFEREYDANGFCSGYSFSWEDIFSDKEHMDPLVFYQDAFELVEQDEFYVVDTGANYSWL